MKPDLVKTSIRKFYNDEGWQLDEHGVTRDALLNEDLREVAKEYVSKCRKRLMRYLPEKGDALLDMASGPVQYPEYLEYSVNFKKHHCVDLSKVALSQAEEKLQIKGEYHCGNFLDLEFSENYFDACISCHTIYHFHKDEQEKAVRKLLRITKPNQPVIIVYSNPNQLMGKVADLMKRFWRKSELEPAQKDFYFYSHPLSFWEKFNCDASLELFPWRSFSARHQKMLFPNHLVGKMMFRLLYKLEETFPSFFIRCFKFYTVVLRPRA
jgi:ubiquinone/menaquinone biosynthesis C-methylase UbiE